MNCLKIICAGAAFAGGVRADPDSLIVPGSLMCMDFANQDGYDNGASVPVSTGTSDTGGTIMPNLAYARAYDMIGSGDRISLSGIFVKSVNWPNALSAKHKVEWSLKKGLHLIVSQSPGIALNEYAGITMPSAISSYIFSRSPVHPFYVSVWRRLTRIQGSASPGLVHPAMMTDTANYLGYHAPALIRPAVTERYNLPGATADPANTVGAKFGASQWLAWTGTKPGAVPATTNLWAAGSSGPSASQLLTGAPSEVLYRLYIEDLDVSGRTWATVRALDEALYNIAFGVGGRFYGDSWSDPATVLP